MAGTKLAPARPSSGASRDASDGERHAVDRLARTQGFARVRANPHGSEVQLVGYDGRYLDRIRLVSTCAWQAWIAAPAGQRVGLRRCVNPRAARGHSAAWSASSSDQR